MELYGQIQLQIVYVGSVITSYSIHYTKLYDPVGVILWNSQRENEISIFFGTQIHGETQVVLAMKIQIRNDFQEVFAASTGFRSIGLRMLGVILFLRLATLAAGGSLMNSRGYTGRFQGFSISMHNHLDASSKPSYLPPSHPSYNFV